MTPKDKAERLYYGFLYNQHFKDLQYNGSVDMHAVIAKEFALLTVDEMIETGRQLYLTTHSTHYFETVQFEYFKNVKKEIEKL